MAKEKKENIYELYFEWWLSDLQKCGLVRKFKKEPESLVVVDPMIVYSNVHYVTKKPKMVSHNLLKPTSYTRDYDVEMHKSLLDVFIGLLVEEDGCYILKELNKRNAGDTFYDFKYYYLYNPKEADDDFVTVSFDVKPGAAAIRFSGGFGSARSFPINQKLMADRYGIFVNKVVPCKDKNSLFSKTFTPSRYHFTDGGTQMRKSATAENDKTVSDWLASIDVKAIPHVEKS